MSKTIQLKDILCLDTTLFTCDLQFTFVDHLDYYLGKYGYTLKDDDKIIELGSRYKTGVPDTVLPTLKRLGYVETSVPVLLDTSYIHDFSAWNDDIEGLHYPFTFGDLQLPQNKQAVLVVNALAMILVERTLGRLKDVQNLKVCLKLVKYSTLLIKNDIVSDLYILNYVFNGLFNFISTDLNMGDLAFVQWRSWVKYHVLSELLVSDSTLDQKENYILQNIKEGDVLIKYDINRNGTISLNPLKTHSKGDPLICIFRGYDPARRVITFDYIGPKMLKPRYIQELEQELRGDTSVGTSQKLTPRTVTYHLSSLGIGPYWWVDEEWLYPLVDNFTTVQTAVHTGDSVYASTYELTFLEYILTCYIDNDIDFNVADYVNVYLKNDTSNLPKLIKQKLTDLLKNEK